MAKKAKRKAAAKGRARAKRLSIRKESVRGRPAPGATSTRAIVISTKAVRGMVIDRSAVSSLVKRGR
jgi:hypothetical protein